MAGLVSYQGITEPAWRQLSMRGQAKWRATALATCILLSATLSALGGTWGSMTFGLIALLLSQLLLESQRRLGTIQSVIARTRIQTGLTVGGAVLVALTGLSVFCALAYGLATSLRIMSSVPLHIPSSGNRLISVNLMIVVGAMIIGHALFKVSRDMQLSSRLWSLPMASLRRIFVDQERRAKDSVELFLMEYAFIATIYGWAWFATIWLKFLDDVGAILAI